MNASPAGADHAEADREELEARIRATWDAADDDQRQATIDVFEALFAEDPNDPVRAFELGGAYDWAGREAEAAPLYAAALAAGLPTEPEGGRDLELRIQYGSTLRNLGRIDEAVTLLRSAVDRYPWSHAARCFLALALVDAGREREAVADLVELCARELPAPGMAYRRALGEYAAELRG